MTNQVRLNEGLAQLSLPLDEKQQSQLLAYIDLLVKWNGTYNLTALREESKMLSHHVLDSLSVVPFVSNCKNLLDVGSGGGMPGIPCAIACPDLAVTLLDSNSKKTTFLRQAVIELGLSNVSVETCRVEELKDQQFDCIISRAFAELSDFVNLTHSLVAKDGFWLAMKGVYPYDEIARLPVFAKLQTVSVLKVPFVDAERHLVRLDCQGAV